MSNKISKIKFLFFLLDLLTIDKKIKFNSLASFQSFLVSSFNSGIAFAVILSQCLVSFDSFLQMPNLCSKSFLFQHNPLHNNLPQRACTYFN